MILASIISLFGLRSLLPTLGCCCAKKLAHVLETILEIEEEHEAEECYRWVVQLRAETIYRLCNQV